MLIANEMDELVTCGCNAPSCRCLNRVDWSGAICDECQKDKHKYLDTFHDDPDYDDVDDDHNYQGIED